MAYGRTVHSAMWPGRLRARSRNPASAPVAWPVPSEFAERRTSIRTALDASNTPERLDQSVRYDPRRHRRAQTEQSQASDETSPIPSHEQVATTEDDIQALQPPEPLFETFNSAHDFAITSSQFNQVGGDQHIHNDHRVVTSSSSFPLAFVSLSDPSSWITLLKEPTIQPSSFMTVDILLIILPALSTLAANVAYKRYIEGAGPSSDAAGSS
ncbi:hypothetical protein ONZ45_g15699 [Pleurotus djamor]|nr:hypothetical protein ONZ45_g15699 [Pleurotus djamor]